MNIRESTALVTGANRGIGRAIVQALLRAGVRRVYAGARDPRSLSDLVQADAGRVIALELDVTQPRVIAAAAERAPDLNLLINNAGVLASYDVLGSSDEALERDFAVNFYGARSMIKAFLPALERAQGAAIVNVLTVVSYASRPVIGGYAASKAAALSLTQSLRPALSAKGIRVHAAVPGAVDTDMIKAFEIEKADPDAVAQAIVEGVARGEEDIPTDAMARDILERWHKNPKELERYFAAL